MVVLEIKDVTKVYYSNGTPYTALSGISLKIRSGDFICIAGPSGSGKTTLLNIMGCLDTPTEGEVYINGRPVTGLSRAEAASIRLNNLGFVFQSFNLIPVLTAFENVEYVLLIKGLPRSERRDMVEDALNKVGLLDHSDKLPSELSGGQQQRVAVARAIVGMPSIILADEPTGNLDSGTGEEIINMFEQLNSKFGTTFLFSSHDPHIISRAGQVIQLCDGRINHAVA